MDVCLLETEISDICIGKPLLRSLSLSATVDDAVSALQTTDQSSLSVWSCVCSNEEDKNEDCRCVGKVSMVDVVCFLCQEQNLQFTQSALKSPVSVLFPKSTAAIVGHLHLHSRLADAIDLIQKGVQNLVVPISKKNTFRKIPITASRHNGYEYCWLTQEDVIRFIFNHVSIFSSVQDILVQSLDIIDSAHNLSVHHLEPASSILPALVGYAAVAVVDDDGRLVGEIRRCRISSCDKVMIAAVETLSAGALMAYVKKASKGDLVGAGRSEAVACYSTSSFLTVVYRALCSRVSYVWVVDDDGTLSGIMTFGGMMKIFRQAMEGWGLDQLK